MKRLEIVSRKVEHSLQCAANICLMLIVALMFSEVISRYIFLKSYGFMEDFSRWLQIWLTYLMLGVIATGRRHIAVDILPKKLPKKYQAPLLAASDIIVLSFAIVLCWSGILSTVRLMNLGAVSASEIAIFSIQHLWIDIASLAKHEGSKEE
jgi:TRAP-type C4-dicarboxylate transport system permease small subunit